MWFFSSMNSIGKIYDQLKVIEQLLIELRVKGENSFNKEITRRLISEIESHMASLQSIVDESSNSVKCADFQFLGEKRRIGDIIWGVTEMLKRYKKLSR